MRLVAAFLAALAPLAWAIKTTPPSPDSYVYNENVISAETAGHVSQRLEDFEKNTGRQFVIALFQSLEGESLQEYVNRLLRAWKIGSREKNDGLLFCLFVKERRWRVEVGYGLEGTLTDLEAADLVDRAATADLKIENYDQAVQDVIDALAAKLGEPEAPDKGGAGGPHGRTHGEDVERIWRYFWRILLGFYVFFWITYEIGFYWGFDSGIGKSKKPEPRYPRRILFISGLFLLLLFRILFYLLLEMIFGSSGRGGGKTGGFSGGGGSSGGGGASGSW